MPAPPNASAEGLQSAEVNVMDSGATGLGIIDDTDAIHAARNAAGVGGKVMFPSGTYLVDGLTASVANQTWELSDGAVVKMKAAASRCLFINSDNVAVKGGVFDASHGTLHDWQQHGIVAEADGVTIRNVEVRNSPGHAVLARRGDRVTVVDCRFINCYNAGVFIQNDVEDTEMFDIVITGNYIETSEDTGGGIGVLAGLSTLTATTADIERIKITGNTVICPIDPAAETSCIGVINCTDFVINDNITIGSHIAVTTANGNRCVISGNRVSSYGGIGIEVAFNMTDCVVSDNVIDGGGVESTVYGAFQSAIQNSRGTVKRMSIVGNTISGSVGDLTGISFGSKSIVESATITGNMIHGDCNSYVGVGFNNAAKNVTISDNAFDAGTVSTSIRGVSLLTDPMSNIDISDNIFTSTSSANLNYGIAFAVGATASGVAVTGNTFEAPSSAGFAAFFIDGAATHIFFTGNSVDAGRSTDSIGIDLYNAVDGFTVSGNQFSNLTEAVVRLMASTAVTMKDIKVTGNSIVNVPHRIRNRNSGGAVETNVISTDE